MKKSSLGCKVGGAAFALMLSASLMVPAGASFADPAGSDVGPASFNLIQIQSGDVVTAYQIFDTSIDDNNNLVYTKKAADLPSDYDTVDKIAAASNGDEVANAIAAKVITSSTQSVSATADASGEASLELDSGYYLVVVTSNSGNTQVYQTLLVDATPDVQNGSYVTRTIADAKPKVTYVSYPSKSIYQGNSWIDHYYVGDEADFKLEARVPSYPADANNAFFSVTDVPGTGLKVLADTFSVKTETNTLSEGDDYSIVANADGTYTIEFKRDFILSNPGTRITIEYKATIESVDATSGRVYNKAYATFAPNPYNDGTVNTDDSHTVGAGTYGFSFRKLAAPDNTPLAGAVFTVRNKNGDVVTYMDAAGKLHADGQVTSDANGYVYVNGLPEGEYFVSETSVPAGYQKVEDFSVYLDEDVDEDSPATDDVHETNFELVADKVDAKVGQLPTTGGAGTIALTAGGILLVAGGSVIVLRKRREDRE